MKNFFKDGFRARADLNTQFSKNLKFNKSLWAATDILLEAMSLGRKILVFGNGGSAAEAQHFAAELVCQLEKKRRALPAIALTTDSSILTAQSNDFGFDSIFSRQIEALCQPGDVVIGLTTSDVYEDGHSRNIFNAFKAAKTKGAKTIGLFSIKTKKLVNLVDVPVLVPAKNTAIIQEVHLAIIHMFCGEIEKTL